MDQSTTGLILRTRPLTETSLIVHWLTPDCGRLATVARGARRPKSPFRGKLDLFYLARLSFARSRRSDLHTLREVSLLATPGALRERLELLTVAGYGVGLLEAATETETPIPEFFELFAQWIRYLDTRPAPGPLPLFALEVRLLMLLGLDAAAAPSGVEAGTRRLLERLAASRWEALSCLRLSPEQRRELDALMRAGLGDFLGGRLGRQRAAALNLLGQAGD